MTDDIDVVTGTPGEYHHKTVEIVKGEEIPLSHELIRDTAKRLIEEVVELGLESGLSPAEIQIHITDGIFNEMRKRQEYPSECHIPVQIHPGNLKVEIVDVFICLDYLRFAAKLSTAEVEEHEKAKLELLRHRARADAYTIIGNRIYKKEARS